METLFYIYLACLIFGGGFLAFTFLFGGGDHDHDFDSHAELDGDGAFELHSGDGDLTTEADVHVDSHGDVSHDSRFAEAASFFSLKNIIYFLAFFGLTGTVLSLLFNLDFLTLPSSIAIGVGAWIFGYKFASYLKNSESGAGLDLTDLKGKTAKVVLDVRKDGKGKILVQAGGISR